jgi:hypothetical protein
VIKYWVVLEENVIFFFFFYVKFHRYLHKSVPHHAWVSNNPQMFYFSYQTQS